MNPALRELYQTMIVDHGKQPRNFHTLTDATHQKEGVNPICGDQLTLYLKIKGDIIETVSFTGSGCAISMASASLLTEQLKGKTIKEAQALFHHFHDMMTNDCEVSEQHLDKLTVLAGVKAFPTRIKCATLSWHTLKACLDGKTDTTQTE